MSEELAEFSVEDGTRIAKATQYVESLRPKRPAAGFSGTRQRGGGKLPLGTRTGQVLAMVTDDTAAYAVPFFVDHEA